MTVHLFGFDIIPVENEYGFWFLGITIYTEEGIHRNLFSLYWSKGSLLLDLFWIRIMGDE